MTTFFISRHLGAIQWIRQQGIQVEHFVSHLNLESISTGDIVIGTLPLQLAYAVQFRGARYLHLSVEVPNEWRGKELTADQLIEFGAMLIEFDIKILI